MKDFFEDDTPEVELSAQAREILLSTVKELKEIHDNLQKALM